MAGAPYPQLNQRQQPELAWAALVADGRVKTLWSDNSVLLLSAGGEAFAHVPPRPGAAPTRQLAEFALSAFRPQLLAALRLRNLHADAPAWCAPLARAAATDGNTFELAHDLAAVYWPTSAGEALGLGLLDFLDGGRAALRRCCGGGRTWGEGGTAARRDQRIRPHEGACCGAWGW